MNEAQVKLGDDSEDDVLYAWRMKAIEDTTYSGGMVNGGFEEFQKKDLYFRNAKSSQVPEKLMGHERE